MTKTIAEIWEGDLFNRQEEAANLEAYIESIWQRPSSREDSKGFVLAVDADYGMGKTFFLKRFAEQMAINHPVAYIDAWKDDLQDEPLIALIATLEEALEDAFGEIEGDLAKTKDNVWDKFKKVSGIVGKGLLKKGAGLIITASAAEAVSTILEGQDEDFTETIKKELEDVGKDTVNGVVSISKVIGQNGNLEEKIKSFKDGQKAIEDLKEALAELVKAISKDGKQAPIVIIIDELDRCRPNYAIKLLEEVKHLFDVEGIVFVLGTNLGQLSKSIKKTYGNDFESYSYLDRFINRAYKIKTPDIRLLVDHLVEVLKIPEHFLDVFQTNNIKNPHRDSSYFKHIMTDIIECFDFSARDIFKLFDILLTSIKISKGDRVLIPYFIPLTVEICWQDKYAKAISNNKKDIKIQIPTIQGNQQVSIMGFYSTIKKFLNGDYIETQPNEVEEKWVYDLAKESIFSSKVSGSYSRVQPKFHPKNYNELINFVTRIDVIET